MDTFSFHRFLGELRFGEEPAELWSHDGLLAATDRLDLDVLSYETAFDWGEPVREVLATQARLDALDRDLVLAWGHPRGLRLGRAADAWDDLERTAEVAAGLGHELLRIVAGGPADLSDPPSAGHVVKRFAPRLSAVAERWLDRGLRLALETHVELPIDAFCDLVDAVPSLGVVLDTGNVVRAGGELLAITERLAPRVMMVHAKDFDLGESATSDPAGPWRCTPLGLGHLPIAEALDILHGAGFTGPVCIELQELSSPWQGRELEVLDSSLAWLRARQMR